MPAIAFLFEGDKLQGRDCDLTYQLIFAQVLKEAREVPLHLRCGGILLWRFSERTTAVERRIAHKFPSIGCTITDDKALRMTLAVVFAKSVAAQYHRIETETLSRTLLTHPVECITVSEFSSACSDLVHAELAKQSSAYLGCFEVDKGDPLLLDLAANGLIPICSYEGGILRWVVPFGDEEPIPDWATDIGFSSVESTFETPANVPRTDLSLAGAESTKLLSTRGRAQHAENVLSTLRDSLDTSEDKSDLKVTFGKSEFGNPRADVRKLRDYSLNEQHSSGKHKALVFKTLLAITSSDWLFLGEQLVAGLEGELVRRPLKDQWGVKYSVVVPVIGLNDVTKLVTSAWIIRPNESPSLVSAYIGHNAETTQVGALANLIVKCQRGAERWTRLYEIAHKEGMKSADDWTPTPFWIVGDKLPISEGLCGSAWVKLRDGRSSFSRWLKKNNLCSAFARGCHVPSRTKSQSLERAQKYCETFARVLRLNGIDCEVKWLYD